MLLPGELSFTVPPELALALFVAPVLLDAAYDASPRDLKDNWAPVTGLVVFAVVFTTAAVAVVAHMLMPTMPWAAAIALGAVVALPDAVAATGVLRQLRPPHRILTILESANSPEPGSIGSGGILRRRRRGPADRDRRARRLAHVL